MKSKPLSLRARRARQSHKQRDCFATARNDEFWQSSRYVVLITAVLLLLSRSGLALDRDDKVRAEEYYRLGQIYYEHGLYEEAEKQFKRALDIAQGLPVSEVAPPPAKAEASPEPQPEPQEPPSPPEDAPGAYTIGIGDSLYITVWENPDLTQDVIVRPDGKISFPLIDELAVEGLTLARLDYIISQRLKEYIRHPDVSVFLKAMGGSKVIILGQVQAPGVYSLTGQRTILEAIALAGGFTEDAVASSVVVVRGALDNPQAERISLNKAIHHPAHPQNIRLQEENIVFVPKKFLADMNYFLDKILNPALKAANTGITMQKY